MHRTAEVAAQADVTVPARVAAKAVVKRVAIIHATIVVVLDVSIRRTD